MDTGRSLSVMALQHRALPQMPTPPTTRASSLHPDLAELDAHLEHRHEVLDQLPEIDAALRREEEQDLLLVQQVVGAHQLHVQAVMLDLLPAHLEGALLLHVVLFHARKVGVTRDADDRAHLSRRPGRLGFLAEDLPQLIAVARGDHHGVPDRGLQARRGRAELGGARIQDLHPPDGAALGQEAGLSGLLRDRLGHARPLGGCRGRTRCGESCAFGRLVLGSRVGLGILLHDIVVIAHASILLFCRRLRTRG